MSVDGVRIADMPDLGNVTDSGFVVGEQSGSGRFSAPALLTYVSSGLAARVAALEGNVTALTARVTALESGVAALAAQFTSLNTRLAYVEAHYIKPS